MSDRIDPPLADWEREFLERQREAERRELLPPGGRLYELDPLPGFRAFRDRLLLLIEEREAGTGLGVVSTREIREAWVAAWTESEESHK